MCFASSLPFLPLRARSAAHEPRRHQDLATEDLVGQILGAPHLKPSGEAILLAVQVEPEELLARAIPGQSAAPKHDQLQLAYAVRVGPAAHAHGPEQQEGVSQELAALRAAEREQHSGRVIDAGPDQ